MDVQNNRRISSRRKKQGIHGYLRSIFSTDRRKDEQTKNKVLSKDFMVWFVCLCSCIAVLCLLLIASSMKG